MKLWRNGHFFTMEKEGETVTAVLTEGSKIVDTGEEAKLKNLYADQITEEVDLNGGNVFPGFVDSHMHLSWYGQSLARLNLNQMRSKSDCLKALKKRIHQLEKDEWLFAEGYNENQWLDDTTPFTLEELDEISPNNPILIRRIDYHNVVINSALIEKIGLQDGQVFEGGGEIDLDSSGKLTGVLKDEATNLAMDAFPAPTAEEQETLFALAIQDLWSKGITGAHSEDLHYFNGFEGTLKSYENVIEEKPMPFRVHLLIHHAELEAFEKSGRKFLDGHPFIELGAMKIFFDGTVGSKTALIRNPYPGTEYHGLQIHSDEAFDEWVKKARKAGLPVAVHIIGDQAFQKTIQVFKKYPPIPGQMDRIIHASLLSQDLLDEAEGMPLLFDIQPQFLSSDLPWALDVLGEEHPPLMYSWKSIKERGFTLAGGSDAPVEIPNPFYGIYAAVTRSALTKDDNEPKVRYFPEEELSVYEAISLYTTGSAIAGYQAGKRGKIKKDYISDFTVIQENPFEMPTDDLWRIKVLKTIVDGQVVYQNK